MKCAAEYCLSAAAAFEHIEECPLSGSYTSRPHSSFRGIFFICAKQGRGVVPPGSRHLIRSPLNELLLPENANHESS